MWHSAGTCQACPLAPDLFIKDITAPSWVATEARKEQLCRSRHPRLGLACPLQAKDHEKALQGKLPASSRPWGHGWSLDDLGDYWLVGVSLSPHVCDLQRRSPILLHPCVIACGSHGSCHIMNSGMMADCMETCKLGCSSLWHMLERKDIKICCHSRRCSFCRKVVSKAPGSHVSLESLFMWDLQAMWGPSCLLRGCRLKVIHRL